MRLKGISKKLLDTIGELLRMSGEGDLKAK